MRSIKPVGRQALLAVVTTVALLLSACGGLPAAGTERPVETEAPAQTEPPAATPTTANTEPVEATQTTPVETTTPEPTPTAEASVVILSASTGNLVVRRGPGVAYDIVGYIPLGNRATALGKDFTGEWVYIERPDSPGRFGWVFRSNYASLEGSLDALELMTPDPAEPAYIRNCTFHPMQIEPGGFILTERFAEPGNIHQVNPGTYEAFDQNVEGEPKVWTAQLHEGQTVDIITDGLNNSYPCP